VKAHIDIRAVLALALTAALGTAPTPAGAQNFSSGDQDGGVHALSILGIPVSPRAAALGEAMGAIAQDPANFWYNAAGLALLRTNAFTVNGQQRFAQTQLVGTAVAFPTELLAFGIGLRAFNAGTVENRVDGELIGGTERAFSYVLEGGGAMSLSPWWRWGGTLYFAQEVLSDRNQSAVGLNSGMQFDINSRLMLGIGVRNLGTQVEWEEGGRRFHQPRQAYLAGGYDLMRQRNLLQTPLLFRGQPIVFDAKLVGQADVIQDQEITFGVGGELTANGVAIGRLGYRWGDDNRRGISLGAGINVGQFRLEYAFRDHRNGGTSIFENDPMGDSHNVSATLFWGGAEENVPVVPVILSQPVDTGMINAAIREAIAAEMERLRPLLDSLRAAQVEILRDTASLISRYVVPVHFGFDSALVREEDMTVLSQIAEVIRQIYPTALVTIEGFADPAGSVQYNINLSRRRAEAVRDVMVSRFGLPAAQFRAVAYGEQTQRQVVPGARRDDPGAEANRRVTFTIDATRRF
jgi:outer membrane protein OmpA-like peptidoglycan-associated protein